MAAAMGARLCRFIAVLVGLACTGCALLRADQDRRRLDQTVYFTGVVETRQPARGPIVVVLYRAADPAAVFVDVIPRTRGVYHLAAPPGEYGILAFEDIDGDHMHQPAEPAVLYRGQPLGLDAIDEPPTAATGLGRIVIPSAASAAAALPAVFGAPYAALLHRREEEMGAAAAIGEARFSPGRVRLGLLQPLRFLQENRAGLFLLEPYDRGRVPVVIVAHSAGGIVSRGALNIAQREGRTAPVHHVVTISTPWSGHAGARWADFGPTCVPGAWLDMAPDSAYLRELRLVKRPADIRYTLFFGFGGRSSFVSGNNDGAVSLHSVLGGGIQDGADFIFGFDEDHASILRSEAMAQRLQLRLDAELDRRGARR